MTSERHVTLLLPTETASAAVVNTAVPRAAEAFGLGAGAALKLTLAVEEVFLYLLDAASRERRMELDIIPRPTAVEVAFGFEARTLDLGALNLTAQADACAFLEQEDFAQVGLLLAASAVDRMRLEHLGAGRMRLALELDREYPEPSAPAAVDFEPQGPFRLELAPASELLQEACLRVLARHAAGDLPRMIRAPGMLVDLVAGGEAKAMVALDGRERVCGLLCWTGRNAKTITFHGPYVALCAKREETARQLLDVFLQGVAKSGASGVMTPLASDLLPSGEYEGLGSLDRLLPDGAKQVRHAAFRLIAEDMGATVWAHPAIQEFLEREYERLDLVRDLRSVVSLGESRPESSVFSASLEAGPGVALLRPLMEGRDASANIGRHVSALRAKGFPNILFELDLAHGWQAAMAGPLADNGFKPRMVHPLGGRSDLVIFQHEFPVAP
ncbi:hypothetical protein [Desulfocurvibacter africanus]|uniref:Uncharacterized protein n=1 Tax=Desulfocurvibacter africanus subsp. africanus str. Walvis Bay TaxID=690850 RepID=F3Z3J0_DESAF|nr:hypothetical protein [Desulfocurvibacter africanus]EGJ50362.1 hypothetical protein Desaf_2033 [Desulfocurvibacter africanus subsp. africanus str. Walvis Bay]